MLYHRILETERIRLRALEPEDIDTLYNWENCTDNWWISSTIAPFSRDILRQYIESSYQDIYTSKQLRLIVEAKDLANLPIGAIDLFDFEPNSRRAGIGILISEKYRHNHYGSEALERMVEYGFKVLNLHQLYANVAAVNADSFKMFQHTGFTVVGLKKQWIRTPTGWVDEYLLQRINETNSLGI